MAKDLESPGGRVFVVDDHPMVRQGLATVLTQAGLMICGEASNSAEALGHPQLATADLAVVDLTLGEENGLDLVTALGSRGIRVLVYSVHEEPSQVIAALNAGANGYVTKREVAHYLVEAVREVLRGRWFVSPRAGAGLAKRVSASGPNSQELSEQQQQVYRLLGEGYTATEIAARLQVSPRTVESYCARIIEKYGLRGMHELRRRAIAERVSRPE